MNARVAALAAALWSAAQVMPAIAQQRPIPAERLQSGSAFLSPELRAQQQDDFANPGLLWVARGAQL